MIMPAPFYPGKQNYNKTENTKLSRSEFIDALTELGKARYHSLHPFHRLLHNGKLSFEQVQAWALNRFYYQWSIPRKDLTLMARISDVNLRLEWRSRVIDHEGDLDGSGGLKRYLQLCETLKLDLDYVKSRFSPFLVDFLAFSVKKWLKNGEIEQKGRFLVLTKKGKLVADWVASRTY